MFSTTTTHTLPRGYGGDAPVPTPRPRFAGDAAPPPPASLRRAQGLRRLQDRARAVSREILLIERGALPSAPDRLRALRAEIAEIADSADALGRVPG